MNYLSEIIQFNKFAKLHNGENILFCKTDYLFEFFDYLKQTNHNIPTILISGNSDYPITDDLVRLAPPCIKKWFAQSAITDHPMVTGMPYGIDNHEDCIIPGHGKGWPDSEKKLSFLANPPSRDPKEEIYANFSLGTHPVRQEIYDICKEIPYITKSISLSHEESNDRSYTKYLADIINHKMSVCPRGNAPAETHRFWEVLYMNRVPIIKQNKGNSYFTELPAIVLEDWKQLLDLDFLNSEYEKVKGNSREM